MNAIASTSDFRPLQSFRPDTLTNPCSRRQCALRRDILKHLTRRHYSDVLEVGCATGLLSRELTRRADRFLGVDCSEGAVLHAREQLAGISHARVRQGTVPHCWPKRSFDLIVLGGVLHHFTPTDIRRMAANCSQALAPHGEIVLISDPLTNSTRLKGEKASRDFIRHMQRHRDFALAEHDASTPHLHFTMQA
ncbi:class I SAM-dependent methyltransferase [Paracoccus aestuariivivens]|uniref:Methyltransferase domain-containing protein n=1 Tax=Paracoccus aestuariivivens TaxID=1820333 RepID=A0A6L6JIP9_9RHOB|nr:class I SAM-dependent methyltransferase [Paracoccus aestuariivivens]MTH79741.1 methyltransferase domain-containing protein [Paracoccus aestuariivivens]